MKLLDVIRTNSDILNAKLECSKLYEHNGLKGTCREEDLISVIRDCLPECYGMKSGQIFSQDDKISNQIDVVIYDAVFSNYFKRDSSSSLFPCESVYGSIEVKSFLDKKTFSQAIENIKSVRKLKRENSAFLDIIPIRSLNFNKDSFKYDESKMNEYFNIIFAYDSVNEKTIKKYIKELDYDYELLPTFIYIYKKGLIFSKVFVQNDEIVAGMNYVEYNNYCLTKYGKDSLTAFFIIMNAMLEQIHLKSINYTEFCNKVSDELKKEEMLVL